MGVTGNIGSLRGSGICELCNKISDWFDECRNENKVLIEQEYLDLVIANILSNSYILDSGCGSAVPISKFFIEQGNIVTGIDGAEEMIAKSQERFPEMSWILGDMRECDLAKKFDAIIAWDSFFSFKS